MKIKRHVIGLLVCILLVSAFQYVGAAWSWADFHPGGDVDVPERDHHLARIGNAMSRPFTTPLMWLMSFTGGYSIFMRIIRWILLPIFYGSILYLAVLCIRRSFILHGTRAV